MTFFSKKVFSLLIGGLLLSSNLYASQEGGDEAFDSSVLPYGRAAYKDFFGSIQKTSDVNELKTALRTFVKTYKRNLTLPVFYSYILKAANTEKISPSHLIAINGLVHDWAFQSKKRRDSIIGSSVEDKAHESTIKSFLTLASFGITRF